MSEYRTTYDRVFKGANENFKGNKLNEKKYEAYQTILGLAKEVSKDHSRFWNIDYGFTEATDESRNAGVYIEMKPPIFIQGEKENIIAAMAQEADDMVFAVLSSGKVRVSFCVRDIWSD